jgi:hypothetical protein
MGRYKKPRRLNPISFVLILALLGCGYAGWKFGPPYWRKWRVKRLIDEAANWGYKRRGALGSEPSMMDTLRERTRRQIRSAGVVDPSLRIHIKVDRQRIWVSAEYNELIQHLFIKKPTKLHFQPAVSVPES